jgi:serine phosphatase RsbU (regulator of sigma subunit)
VTDALNVREEEFGIQRLADLLAANGQLSAQELVDEILRAVSDFSEGTPQFDDLTMVVLKRALPRGGNGQSKN